MHLNIRLIIAFVLAIVGSVAASHNSAELEAQAVEQLVMQVGE